MRVNHLDISEAEEFFLHKTKSVSVQMEARGVGNIMEEEFLNPLAAAPTENRKEKDITSLKAKKMEDDERVDFV